VNGLKGSGLNRRGAMKTSPVALGYVRVPIGAPPGTALARSVLVAGLAAGRGWTVAELFVEDDTERPLLAFTSLLVAARMYRPVAVLLSGPSDLGSTPAGALAMRARIEREICVPVLVASTPASTPAPPPVSEHSAPRWLR
jgi:hypothetical protein